VNKTNNSSINKLKMWFIWLFWKSKYENASGILQNWTD